VKTFKTPVFNLVLGMCAAAGLVASAVAQQAVGITTKDIEAGFADPTRWLTVYGDYSGQRHSPLKQITAANVANLAPVWTFQTGVTGNFQATPIVLDGVLYFTGANNNAWAVDARTGKQIWSYRRQLPAGLKVCCGPVNRGFAVWGDRLYMTTLDAHLVAFEMKTGKVVWDVELADYNLGYASTVAPLVVKDKLIVGIAGGEYANRGFLDAYDPITGERKWRFWTVPAKGEPGSETWPEDVLERGGAPTWLTGTYDPELNLIYWGTGNPNPDWDGSHRQGDNLYAASVIALNPDTGKLAWHFQYTPHDTHDWDANQVPVLADLRLNGQTRKVLMQANRNGFFYLLDRTNGKFISAKAYVHQDWASGFTPEGRPIEVPGHEPTETGTTTCPDWYGGTNHMAPSFDASRGLFFLTVRNTCARFISRPTPDAKVGDRTMGGSVVPLPNPPRTGGLKALDAATGETKWEVKYDGPGWAGVLSTAGGVVFSCDHAGLFMAVDSNSGKVLYTYQTGGTTFGPPTTYQLDGKQYIVQPSGGTVTAFALK
jgi:alcohol dehydrogenase (cytochrome c)